MWRLAVLLVWLGVSAIASADAAERIVSTSPSITETLFALGLGDRVVAVSRYCRYPAEAAQLPRIGSFLEPDAELIVRLRPDLVFVHPESSGIRRKLATFPMSVITVDRGTTLAGVFSSIRTIANGAGVPERGKTLIRTLEERLAGVRTAVAGRTPRKVLLIVGRRAGTLTDLVAVGPRSYLSDLVTIAGGVNVLGEARLPEYPRISMETVIRLAPDVIVDAGDMGDTPDDRRSRQARTEALWTRQPLVAASTGRVHAVISDAFVVPGPRVVDVAETFARWFHGVGSPDAAR
jgi:iron complex transport system substrate-binding protein